MSVVVSKSPFYIVCLFVYMYHDDEIGNTDDDDKDRENDDNYYSDTNNENE